MEPFSLFLQEQRRTGEFVDCTILCGVRTIPAHKVVLAQSKVLGHIMSARWSNSPLDAGGVVELEVDLSGELHASTGSPEACSRAMEVMVDFLYDHGEESLAAETLKREAPAFLLCLLHAASYLDLPAAMDRVADAIFVHGLNCQTVTFYIAHLGQVEYGDAGRLVTDASWAFLQRNALDMEPSDLAKLPLSAQVRLLCGEELFVPTESRRFELTFQMFTEVCGAVAEAMTRLQQSITAASICQDDTLVRVALAVGSLMHRKDFRQADADAQEARQHTLDALAHAAAQALAEQLGSMGSLVVWQHGTGDDALDVLSLRTRMSLVVQDVLGKLSRSSAAKQLPPAGAHPKVGKRRRRSPIQAIHEPQHPRADQSTPLTAPSKILHSSTAIEDVREAWEAVWAQHAAADVVVQSVQVAVAHAGMAAQQVIFEAYRRVFDSIRWEHVSSSALERALVAGIVLPGRAKTALRRVQQLHAAVNSAVEAEAPQIGTTNADSALQAAAEAEEARPSEGSPEVAEDQWPQRGRRSASAPAFAAGAANAFDSNESVDILHELAHWGDELPGFTVGGADSGAMEDDDDDDEDLLPDEEEISTSGAALPPSEGAIDCTHSPWSLQMMQDAPTSPPAGSSRPVGAHRGSPLATPLSNPPPGRKKRWDAEAAAPAASVAGPPPLAQRLLAAAEGLAEAATRTVGLGEFHGPLEPWERLLPSPPTLYPDWTQSSSGHSQEDDALPPALRFGVEVGGILQPECDPNLTGHSTSLCSNAIVFAGCQWSLDLKRYLSHDGTDNQATEFIAVYLRRRRLEDGEVTGLLGGQAELLRPTPILRAKLTAAGLGPVAVAAHCDDSRPLAAAAFSIRLCGAPGAPTSNSICGRSTVGKQFGFESSTSWGWDSYIACDDTLTDKATWNSDRLRFMVQVRPL